MIEFARADIGVAEEQAVLEVLRSGWLTSGAKMREFEDAVSAYHHGATALAVSSATAGLHLALEAMGVGPGDEVILPTLTFTATAEVVRYLGGTPVFADVDPVTMCITAETIEHLLTPKTKCVIVVHFGGYVCDMNRIRPLCEEVGAYLLEDAAHAMGSVYHGDRVGTCWYSDAAVFSFYATKCITTAEGGMVMTGHPKLAERMKTMRLHGIDRDAFDRYKTNGGWAYDVVAPGFKYNMPDVLAALGIAQFKRMEEMRRWRTMLAVQYATELEGLPVLMPPTHEAITSSWHLFVLRLMLHDRDQFVARMAALGVRCSVHFKPLHQMTVWKPFVIRGQEFSVADAIYASCVSLPIYSTLRGIEMLRVTEAVRECLN